MTKQELIKIIDFAGANGLMNEPFEKVLKLYNNSINDNNTNKV